MRLCMQVLPLLTVSTTTYRKYMFIRYTLFHGMQSYLLYLHVR